MKLTIYLYDLGRGSLGSLETLDVQPHPSAFYGTGRPTRKVDNITIRFTRTDISDVSPASIEGTRQAFEELVTELQKVIDTNKRWAGVKWEDLPDKASDLDKEYTAIITDPLGQELIKKAAEPVEELVGVTTIKEYEPIEKIKGSCPKCGGPLEFKEHVDTFNEDGSPIAEDTCRDPYCPSCKLLWLSQEAS